LTKLNTKPKISQMKKIERLLPILAILFMLIGSNVYAACPPGDGTVNALGYKILYFGASSDFPSPTGPLGSATNPLTDWNSSNGGVDAINDCNGNVELRFVSCYFNTDGPFGDINYTLAPTENNVILDGQGAIMENMAASSSFLRADGLDNWTIKNFTFIEWNQNAILLTDMTNTVVENCIFDSNPTQRAVRVDNDDNASDVTFNNCIFSNNPPVSETPSTGAVEVREDEFAGPLVVNFNNCDFDCNARQGFGGGGLWISPVSFPSNNGPEVNITGGSFVNNFSGTDTGDGGAIGINGEDSFLNIDGTLFSCNYSEASTGDGGGGAIRINGGPTVDITNAAFYGNYCTNSAGSIAAGGYGGAININSTSNVSTLTISNSTFTGNQASRGGAFYLESGNVSFDNVLVTGNTSVTDPGGGVNNAGAAFTTINTSITGNSPDDVVGSVTDNGGTVSVVDPGITACETCFSVPPPGCDASSSDLVLACPYFCSTGTPPNATGDANLTIDMSNFVAPNCTNPLDYTYTFLVLDATGTVVCEFDATDADTQDPLGTPAYTTTIAGTPDGIPDAMDPAVQHANLCAGLSPGDYTIVGFHYLTADAPPIVTPFTGQTLATIQGYLTDPPTSPVACGALGTETPFTVLEPIEVAITTSCPDSPDATYLADVTVTGGFPLEVGAGTYTLTTNFGVTSYTFGTPITAQVIPAGQTVDVTVAADGNGANGTMPPGPLCFDCMATVVSEPELVCAAPCTPPDITVDPTFAEICVGDAYDLATATVTDATVYTGGEAVVITYHSATPADGTNVLPATSVMATMTTTYYILATNDNATVDTGDDCSTEIPFTVIVDTEAPTITCPAPFTMVVCGDIADYPPATTLAALNDSVQQLCTGPIDITFGSDDGFFDITATNDPIVEVEGSAAVALDYDIIDETATTAAGVTAGPGGASDIFFNFSLLPTMDPYGGTALPTSSVQFEILQSTSGIRGNIVGASASTGDVRCYQVEVQLAGHLKVEAQDFTALVTSINTSGELYESASVVFLDANGNPFGSADYAGYYSDPVSGTIGNGTGTLNSSTWDISGTGVYVAQDQSIIDAMTDPFNPVGTANAPSDGFDPNGNIDGGLAPTTLVSGVIMTVCLEDIAASATEGGSTTSSTSFTSTLNGFSLNNACINSAVCDNNALADLVLTSMDVQDPSPIVPADGGCINRTYTVTDACGNEASCIQKITVLPCAALCPDIIDGTLSATANAAPATDVCSGDMVTVCVDVDLTNDATATVEFSNDGGTTWNIGTLDNTVMPNTFCYNFTETNTACDAAAVSYQAQFNLASLMDNTCSQDLQTMDATPAAVTVNVYPDVATTATAMLTNDGACGPSLAQNCPNYTVTNTYDANGATPNFSAETGIGALTFTITNAAAPTACQTATVPATYNCVVDVPELTITKDDTDNGDDMQTVAMGSDAMFTITVSNTGTEDLCNVSVTDPNGLACEMTYTANGGTLVVGDTWTYMCTVPGATANYVNTAIVNAQGCTSGTIVSDNDPSTVFVPEAEVPMVTVDKNDADNGDDMQTVSMGGDAMFTITVTNNGTEDLCNVSVTDPNGLACEMTYTANGGTLVVGDTWTYMCTVPGATANYVNTAIVNAQGCTSGTIVSDNDPSTVFVPEAEVPMVTVDKNDADNGDDAQTINSGGDAVFTITVSNTGTEDLCNVSVSDPNGLACEMTYTANGGTLVVGDTWTYMCTVPGATANYVNTAIVNAQGCTSGTMVMDDDPSCVTVENPVLASIKTSEFTDANGDGLLNPGEIITYSIVVTNYGTADALNVIFNDAIPAGTTLLGNESTTAGTISSGTDPVTANLGTVAANGGTAIITFDVIVDMATPNGFIIMNQGTFMADNHPDVPTDDPTTPTTPDDPTTDPVVDPSCTNANNGNWNH